MFRFQQLKVRECRKCRRILRFQGRQKYPISTPAKRDKQCRFIFSEFKNEEMLVTDPKRSLESVQLIHLSVQKFGKDILNSYYCSVYTLDNTNHPLAKISMTTAPQVLVIKLMQFEGDQLSATGKKKRTQVDFSARLRIDATLMRSLTRARTL